MCLPAPNTPPAIRDRGAAMQPTSPDRKYLFGRRVMLISAILYATSRAATYLPNPANETPKAIEFISVIVPVWFWALLWLLAAALCVVDLLQGVGRRGISSVVGLMLGWGATYVISYIDTVLHEGWGSREWSTAAGFAFGGGMILGLLIKVGALKRHGEHE